MGRLLRGSHAEPDGESRAAYRVEAILGTGGSATVYRARRVQDAAPSGGVPLGGKPTDAISGEPMVAIKRLHPHLAHEPSIVARFRREAELSALLRHPHVIPVLDHGMDGVLPFLVMACPPGARTGASAVRGVEQWSVARALRVVSQVLNGLQAIHDHGVIHRDLKPSNVLLHRPPTHVADGQLDREHAHVLDFGLAVLWGRDRSAQLTPLGVAMGTPAYISPEQLSGARAPDPRMDVYAAGALLYALLAGCPPFVGASSVEICRQVLMVEPPPLRAFRRDVPSSLEAAILVALAKDPAERFATALAMGEALGDAANSCG